MVDKINPVNINKITTDVNRIKKSVEDGKTSAADFKEVLNGYINDVNKMQLDADKAIENLVSGEIDDVSKVITAVEEANVAFQMMMQIRNKLTEAYQEIMRMQV
jgi:flagellar hook-basal body complex protein FliE